METEAKDAIRMTETGLNLRYGSYDEARTWIGRKLGPRWCEDEVNWPAIKYFCSLVGDGNPSYWDEQWAGRNHGGILSPPGLLFVWSMALPWRPDKSPARKSMLVTQVPLPGDTIINVSTESEFLKPIRVGDRLAVEEEVVNVTPEKHTRLGTGHFITTRLVYRNQNGETVALHANVLFRFRAAGKNR